jgi:hypothetical protein
MNQESLRIILKTYSKGGFTEDEAVQLIEDLCNNNTIINNPPYYPWTTYPWITYDTKPEFPKYEVTCKTK